MLREILKDAKGNMNFSEMHERLTDYVNSKVSNGEVSERALAKHAGISQPHLHNVLKGKRLFSFRSADSIMGVLSVSVLDLVRGPDHGGFQP